MDDNDLIRREDAIALTLLGDAKTVADAIAALPAVAASQDADADLLFDAYKGLLVLHRMLDKHGLIVGAETTNKLADRIVAAHPEFPPRTALRSAVAASQPADPVTNADSRQRVTVDSLATLMFNEWKRVDPRSKVAMFPVSYMSTFADMARAVLAAINMQPDPACCLGLSPTDCADAPSRHCVASSSAPTLADALALPEIAALVAASDALAKQAFKTMTGGRQDLIDEVTRAVSALRQIGGAA